MAPQSELTEADLHRLWQRGLLPREGLCTGDGQPVEVLYAGAWNEDAGPDFRNAIIRIGDEMVKGDVEIHLEAELWFNHRHHEDPVYNRVVLHVALDSGKERAIVREDGIEVAQMLLPAQQVAAISTPLRVPQLARLIVQSCPLRRREPVFIRQTVIAAAEERLTEKAARFAEQLGHSTWDQVLYFGLCEALGYAANQIPFRKLAGLLPVDRILAETRIGEDPQAKTRVWALLFGAAGLLPCQARPVATVVDAELREFVSQLEGTWQEMAHRRQLPAMRPEEWQFFRLRPANFPTRRLAALGVLITRFARGGLLGQVERLFEAHADFPKRLVSELQRLFVVPAEGVWCRISRLDRDPDLRGKGAPASLLGSTRAREIVINVVLPLMYLYGTDAGNARIINLVREVYSLVPKLSDNIITRAMGVQLGGVAPVPDRSNSAAIQQGMVQLHKVYCQSLRCEVCQRLHGEMDRMTLRLRDRIDSLRRKHRQGE